MPWRSHRSRMPALFGVSLGQFGKDLFAPNGPPASGTVNFTAVEAATFALIGGFAAEVVYQVLQRFADTLVTAVKGTGKERAEANAERDATRKMADAASQIYDAINLSTPEEQVKRLKEIAKNITSSKK
jgi:L-alanine-DL-glutamate epimerase-like enolase superfamily enzyme